MIESIAKVPLNGIIGLINGVISGLNFMIGGLNKIKIDAPDWVTKLTGITSFGINIPNIPKIPGLNIGMDYVPYDNYLAYLHEGEAVLTKSQAEKWRNPSSQSNNTTSSVTNDHSITINGMKIDDSTNAGKEFISALRRVVATH